MLKKLFTPYSIGNCLIPNRLVVTAMVTNYNNSDGTATERYIAYHEAKARGGWGLIITEDYSVNEQAMGYKYIAGLWNDSQIASHKAFTDRIHQYESKVFCQIYHAGRQSHAGVNGGVQPVAPSAIPCPWCRDLPRELTIPEIKKIVQDFGDTALRAQKAGFDGIEIHGGHGYLIAEFMSPYANKRIDEYGGNLLNRLRIVKEIIDDIRTKVGPDFPVIMRFSADEVIPGGRDMSETRIIVQFLEKWGLDGLHISSGVYGNHGIAAPMHIPHAWIVQYAEEVKKLVKIPIITVNRINDPFMADNIIAMDKADFVGMGRGSLADPDLPNKAKEGDFESIRYCIGCLQGCTGALASKGTETSVHCLVNPTLGQEYKIDYSKVPVAKKVFVAGGGPGGMEAARAAALKGHEVHLYESNDQLGGQFRSAAYPPFKGELATFTVWQIRELNKLGVNIHLTTTLTADIVKQEKPDAVIVATGATPIMPRIPGIDSPNVFNAQDVLLGKVATGNNIIVAGGGMVGAETAAHLALQQKKVCVVDMLPEIAGDLDGVSREQLLKLLDEYRVEQITNAKVYEICTQGVLLDKHGIITLHPADTVVIALGSRKNDKLYEELEEFTGKKMVIGDAVLPRQAIEAIFEGFEAGLNI
ncbi:NADH oxidase [Sporomusa silvacetica DSM 10669]|uniref:NADH oxidase n=1 Tax=Sporomusa silvacetica DSM 10669 TaxID=1123289 RepID=A0ABZ3ITT2_9FIRM|nr:FAD-dependent oxidoreductase [Sporomusa silvacetica]OZC15118.1 NADH oxidase [Sporomusa silvacetica DSM 10669]